MSNTFVVGGVTQSTFGTYALNYAPSGNVGQIGATVPNYTAHSGTTTYGYSIKNEVTSENSPRLGTYNHVYDAAGNPTTFRGVAGQTFNAENQPNASGYAYDGGGNPTTYATKSLTFDAENRMVSYGTNWSATYRPDGLRASKTFTGAPANVATNGTTYFVYDGDKPILEVDASGNVSAVNTFGATGLLGRHISSYAYSWFHVFEDRKSVV